MNNFNSIFKTVYDEIFEEILQEKFDTLENLYLEFCKNEYGNSYESTKEFESGKIKILYTELTVDNKDCDVWIYIDLQKMTVTTEYIDNKNNNKLKSLSRKTSEEVLLNCFKNSNFDSLFIEIN